MASAVGAVDLEADSAVEVVATLEQVASVANRAVMAVHHKRLLLRRTRSLTSLPVVVSLVPSSSSAT